MRNRGFLQIFAIPAPAALALSKCSEPGCNDGVQAQVAMLYPLAQASQQDVCSDPELFRSTLQQLNEALGVSGQKGIRLGGKEIDFFTLYKRVCLPVLVCLSSCNGQRNLVGSMLSCVPCIRPWPCT